MEHRPPATARPSVALPLRAPRWHALLLALVAVLSLGAPSTAAARSCSIGTSQDTINTAGETARFWSLHARQGMNCPSARYVLNQWLRPAFRRSSVARLPYSFYDGYVTWTCRRGSGSWWTCREYTSNTAFSFKARIV